MKEIQLSQGRVMIVDDEDYDLVSQFTWSWSKSRNTYYAKANTGKRGMLAHRLILGAKPGQLVDHKDGNGLNNQRGNIRFCSVSQNSQHAKARKDNTTGYRGVSILDNGFVARIRVNGIRHYLGYFGSVLDAARAYDRAAKLYHHSFASLNFLEGR